MRAEGRNRTAGVVVVPHQEYSKRYSDTSYSIGLRGAEKLAREELDFLQNLCAVLKSVPAPLHGRRAWAWQA